MWLIARWLTGLAHALSHLSDFIYEATTNNCMIERSTGGEYRGGGVVGAICLICINAVFDYFRLWLTTWHLSEIIEIAKAACLKHFFYWISKLHPVFSCYISAAKSDNNWTRYWRFCWFPDAWCWCRCILADDLVIWYMHGLHTKSITPLPTFCSLNKITTIF